MKNSFSVIGGDARNVELAKMLANNGHEVYVYGLEKSKLGELGIQNIEICNTLEEAISNGNIVIGPIPFSRDGEILNLPLSSKIIELEDFASWLDNKALFAGSIPEDFYEITKDIKVVITDLMKIEELAVLNIIATAEGAISKIIENTDYNLQGSNVLIIGFGRIGKILSNKLRLLGANVTCSARKTSDLAWIEAYGYEPVNTYELGKLENYDIIINTVPQIIVTKEKLEKVNNNCLLLELASKPGGFDLDAVEQLDLNYVPALGLPGKIAAKSTASYLKRFILNY
ncbi:MAG: dipicolinate synthase subunit DpsA [Clostridia bacterium]|nr:dipicolinate synthase subunit DpsA [Clostridia bacterium]